MHWHKETASLKTPEGTKGGRRVQNCVQNEKKDISCEWDLNPDPQDKSDIFNLGGEPPHQSDE